MRHHDSRYKLRPEHVWILMLVAGVCFASSTTGILCGRWAVKREHRQTRLNLIRVIDPDMIQVDYVPARMPSRRLVRLLGVQPIGYKEPLYQESRAALRDLLAAGPLTLEFEESGRPQRGPAWLTGFVIAGGGDNVNVVLVRHGWARADPTYTGWLAQVFRAAEDLAKAEQRGLWAEVAEASSDTR